MPATQAELRLRSQVAAHTSWANTHDRSARTAPARTAMLRRFEDQVDPDRVLSVDERNRRAESARKAYFAGLALKSARARRRAREALDELTEAGDALTGGAA